MCNTKPLCFEYADHHGEVLLLLASVMVSPATDISAKFNTNNMVDTHFMTFIINSSLSLASQLFFGIKVKYF